MDKILTYKKIVRQMLLDYASREPENDNGIENQIITDDEHGHYIWFAVGWEGGERYFYATYIHISIKPNGRVWLHHDGTSLALAIRMQERGIPASDIVIGFKAPIVRPEMSGGFALE